MIGRLLLRSGMRLWPVRGLPYVITYYVESEIDTLVILSVMHGARRRDGD